MKKIIVDLKKDRVSIATGSEHQVEIYTDKQIEKILFRIENQKKVTLRDRMIIQILIVTGVRVSELCNIKLKNIYFLADEVKSLNVGNCQDYLGIEIQLDEEYRFIKQLDFTESIVMIGSSSEFENYISLIL